MEQLEWGKRTYVMGILNITPDSFSGDGVLSKTDAVPAAVEQAKQFIAQGAHILDLGAESSRPGSEAIPADKEIKRILPVLKAVRSVAGQAIISIDTYKADTAEICLQNGADWINDIWGLRADTRLAQVIASHKAAVILMHNRSSEKAIQNLGDLGNTYSAASYSDVMESITSTLSRSAALAKNAGISNDKIILDPGIGFGKSLEDNLAILNRLDEMKSLGYPILIGPSRKSFIGQVLDLPVNEREEGTAAAVAIGIARGADIIRVHNVRHMARVAQMCDAILKRPSSG